MIVNRRATYDIACSLLFLPATEPMSFRTDPPTRRAAIKAATTPRSSLTAPRERDSVGHAGEERLMSKLRLTFACGPYDRTLALRDGSIAPEGIELNYIASQPPDIFWRMLQFNEFEI